MQTASGHLAEVAAEAYDVEASRWDSKHVNVRAMAENRYVFDLVQRERHLEGDVLEIACGTGLLLEWCRVDPKRYVGVDISAGMVGRARAKFPQHRFEVADMSSLPFDDAEFDCVTNVFAGFSYTASPLATLSEFARVLRPGGLLMIMPYALKELELGEYVVHDRNGVPVPRFAYSADELAGLMHRDFMDVRVVGFSGPLTRQIAPTLPQVAADALVELESKALRWVPHSSSSFMIGTGRRRC